MGSFLSTRSSSSPPSGDDPLQKNFSTLLLPALVGLMGYAAAIGLPHPNTRNPTSDDRLVSSFVLLLLFSFSAAFADSRRWSLAARFFDTAAISCALSFLASLSSSLVKSAALRGAIYSGCAATLLLVFCGTWHQPIKDAMAAATAALAGGCKYVYDNYFISNSIDQAKVADQDLEAAIPPTT